MTNAYISFNIMLTVPDTPLNNAYQVGSFDFWGNVVKTLKVHEAPITIDEQIKNLLDLGLVIDDRDYASKILSKISYYRLVKAYSLTLKENNRYKKGATFENIVDLYQFNAELRAIVFVLIEAIEISLRANISNFFSLRYGNFGFRDINNFGKKLKQKRVLIEIEREIARNSRSPFIKNFKKNYKNGDIPLYAAIEVTSFGVLSKFFKNMKNEDKNEIAKYYGVAYFYFESFIENFSHIRNICAHYGRLYNIKIAKSPKLYNEYKKYNISNNTLFASILSLKLVSDRKLFTLNYSYT